MPFNKTLFFSLGVDSYKSPHSAYLLVVLLSGLVRLGRKLNPLWEPELALDWAEDLLVQW